MATEKPTLRSPNEREQALLEGFFRREESALREAEQLYGARMQAVAMQITCNREDAEECVQDALYAAWRTIPPVRPEKLQYYLIRAARNAALNLRKSKNCQKRGGDTVSLEEWSEMLPGGEDPEAQLEAKELSAALNHFLAELPEGKRALFLRRYFYLQPITEIAEACRMSPGRVRVTLERLRKALQKELQQKKLL